ncbi:MAG: hypothetical protein AB8B60_16400 [Sulfitobacter sp.]
MRKAALIVLYPLVALLFMGPLAFAFFLSVSCMNPTGGACRTVTAQDWFAGELAGIWMPPFVLALALTFVIARLHKAGMDGASE